MGASSWFEWESSTAIRMSYGEYPAVEQQVVAVRWHLSASVAATQSAALHPEGDPGSPL